MRRGIESLWNADLIRPALALIRAVVTVLSIVVLLGGYYALSRMAGEDWRMLLFGLALTIAVAVVYVAVLVVPETCALVLRLEEATRSEAARQRRPRYAGLHVYGMFMRIAAISSAGYLLFYYAERMTIAAERKWNWLYRLRQTDGDLRTTSSWTAFIVVIAAVAALAVILRAWRRERARTGTYIPSAPMFATALLALYMTGSMLRGIVLWFTFRQDDPLRFWPCVSFGYLSTLVTLLWMIAGAGAAKRIASGNASDEMQRIRDLTAVIGAVVLLVLRGASLTLVFEAVRAVLYPLKALAPGEANRLQELAEKFLAGHTSTQLIVMAAIVATASAIAWMKSDAARALVNLERNLRHDDPPVTNRSPYIAVVTAAAWTVAASLTLTALLLFLIGNVTLSRVLSNFPDNARRLLGDLVTSIPAEWLLLRNLIIIFAIVNVVRLTFDLVSETDHPAAKPFGYFSLRVIVAVQYFVGAAAGVAIAVIAWKSTKYLPWEHSALATGALRLCGITAACLVFLWVTFFAAIIRNIIGLEANLRREGMAAVSGRAGFPALSLLATFGKVFAALCVLLSVVAVIMFMKMTDSAGVLIAGIPLVFGVYIVMNAGPDFARLLLTLERDVSETPAASPATLGEPVVAK